MGTCLRCCATPHPSHFPTTMDTKGIPTDIESVDRTTPVLEGSGDAAATKSDQRLRELGYKSEFKREMSLFGVLGISFCAIGILTGMSSAFQTGLFSGGPLGLFWGWNVRLLCICHLSFAVRRNRNPDMQLVHVAYSPVLGGNLQCLVSVTMFICLARPFLVYRMTVRLWEGCTSGCAR